MIIYMLILKKRNHDLMAQIIVAWKLNDQYMHVP